MKTITYKKSLKFSFFIHFLPIVALQVFGVAGFVTLGDESLSNTYDTFWGMLVWVIEALFYPIGLMALAFEKVLFSLDYTPTVITADGGTYLHQLITYPLSYVISIFLLASIIKTVYNFWFLKKGDTI